MKNKKPTNTGGKSIILWLSLFLYLSYYAHSQEFFTGLKMGILPNQGSNLYVFGGNMEYRPKHAYFSINTDPFVLFNPSYATFTEPIYLKFIIGKKFRVCPSAGGFVRTSRNYGWLLGLHFEYPINQKLFLFSKNELYTDYWKDTYPGHFGNTYTFTNQGKTLLLSVGVKMMWKK